MKILGYGEDGLTYWALSCQMSVMLETLGDRTSVNVAFFRPSLGRGAHGQFGEFDAIVGTQEATYAIECKWETPSPTLDIPTILIPSDRVPYESLDQTPGPVLALKHEQMQRHRIFGGYRKLWPSSRPQNWNQFSATHGPDIRQLTGRAIPGAGSVFAQNFGYLLRALETSGPIVDVLLFFRRRNGRVRQGPTGFRCINMEYETLPGCNFFELGEIT